MDDDRLLSDLEQATTGHDDPSRIAQDQLIEQIVQRAESFRANLQYESALALLRRANDIAGPLLQLNRQIALTLGARAERVLGWADRLGISPPADLLAWLEADLQEAGETDPALGDIPWNLAVLRARFHADYVGAADHLQEAMALGYAHPMVGRLMQIIRAAPPIGVQPVDATAQMRQLVLALAAQMLGPLSSSLSLDHQSASFPGERDTRPLPQTFGDYVDRARKIAEQGSLSGQACVDLLEVCDFLPPDTREYVADLLRRTVSSIGDKEATAKLTGQHLALLRAMAFQLGQIGAQSEDKAWFRRSRQVAQKGSSIIASSGAIDPDLHADLLIAKGQALYYEDEQGAMEAIRAYQEALRLKRQALNDADVQRLKEILWRQIDHRVGRTMASMLAGGMGQAVEILKVCAEVADDLDDPVRSARTKLHLATALRQIRDYPGASALLHRQISEALAPDLVRDAQMELASVYAEQGFSKEAAALQKQLLDAGAVSDPASQAILWSNYANSLKLLGDLESARAALERSWELLPPEQKEKTGNTAPTQGARIQALLAELALERGQEAEAQEHIRAAEALDGAPLGLDGLYFHSIKARCLVAEGQSDAGAASLDVAIHNLSYMLERGPSLPAWESLLQGWAHLDQRAIRLRLEGRAADRFEQALLRAERAKGRILAWLEHWRDPQSAERALSLDRQVEALAAARRWLAARPGRRILSLYATTEGLGVFSLDGDGQARGAWLPDFDYEVWRKDTWEPWETLLAQSAAGPNDYVARLAGALTESLLDAAGAWLWRADQDLATGGTDLIIIPHRAFRSLPLAHSRLPSGRRLSELFESAVILPSLADLAQSLGRELAERQDGPAALADADGSLPFARCEAALVGAGRGIVTGAAVTREAVAEALGRQGTLLLSLHGQFEAGNPYLSRILASDGDVMLQQFVLGQTPVRRSTVVLGVCEAGRSQRSLSDEPLGFAAMLLQAGATAVVAPAWPVDDFASFLFVTRLFADMQGGAPLSKAVHDAAHWLRTLAAREALERVGALMEQISAVGASEIAASASAELEEQTAWLRTFAPTDRPFRSPLDWAAFQVTGLGGTPRPEPDRDKGAHEHG